MLGAVRKSPGFATANFPAWRTPTLLNGWSPLAGSNDYPSPGFRKLDTNLIEFRGLVVKNPPTASSIIMQLPADCLPGYGKRFYGFDTNLWVIEVFADGRVQLGYANGLPQNGLAVTLWDNQDEAFREIAAEIQDVAITTSTSKR